MHQNKRIIMWLKHEYGEGNDNVKTVIEALEKQIPRKPFTSEEGHKACSCGMIIQLGNKRNCMYYCHNCGQRIDWEE